jgi:site-specific DNA recombinase
VIQLLEEPDLIRTEIQRRLKEIQDSNPTRRRKEVLLKEIARTRKSIEKLLDAYQENLLDLEELRKRMPELRRREKTITSELQALDVAAADQQIFLRLADNIENFLRRLREAAETMDVLARQKLLRLVVKEILINRDTIKIKHSIPAGGCNTPPGSGATITTPSYLLRSWSHLAAARKHIPALRARSVGVSVAKSACQGRGDNCPFCRRFRIGLSTPG